MWCGTCFYFGNVTFRQALYFSMLVTHQPACFVSGVPDVLAGVGVYSLNSISCSVFRCDRRMLVTFNFPC